MDPHVRGPLRRRRPARAGGGRGLSRAARLLALLALAACDPASRPERTPVPGESTPIAVTDAAGRTVRLDAAPRRVVSLVPAVTSMIVALGAEDALAGRTDFDTLAVVRGLPSVGNGLEPDLERLLSLRPDLVIRFHGPQDDVTGPALDARGIPHLGVRPDRIADVRGLLGRLGRVLGREARADSLRAALDAELAEVGERVAGRPPVRAAYLLGGEPPWVAGPDTFLAELLALAGGENVFDDLDGLYAPVSVEQLLVRAPEVLLVGRGTVVDPRLRARARVVELPPEVESPSLRLGRSAHEIARALHPEAFE